MAGKGLGSGGKGMQNPNRGFESLRRLLSKGLEKSRLRVSEKRGDPYAAFLIRYNSPDSQRRLRVRDLDLRQATRKDGTPQ